MPTASRVTGDCGGSSHGQGRLCGRGRCGSAALQLVLPNLGVDNNPYHTFRACAGSRGTITITLTTPPALSPVCARPSVSTSPICPPSKGGFLGASLPVVVVGSTMYGGLEKGGSDAGRPVVVARRRPASHQLASRRQGGGWNPWLLHYGMWERGAPPA